MAWGFKVNNPSGQSRLTGDTLTLRTVHWEILSAGSSGRRSVPGFSESQGLLTFAPVEGSLNTSDDGAYVSWDAGSGELTWDLSNTNTDVTVSMLMYG
ncbi:hypothetical protein [Halofilum ochraceum]|uniref:hypothetical protein n=1 Tax=Halofilum ochraceum TaxID=1611323 RepID=UPI0008D9ED27|nr:hypothetical protein [Halofilum ochraceum]